MDKDLFDISGDRLRWRYVIFWSPSFHQFFETTIFHNFERPFTLWYPTHNFSPRICQWECFQVHQVWSLPCLCFGMLTMRVGNLGFSDASKLSSDGTIPKLCFRKRLSCSINATCIISSSYSFLPPAILRMLAKITCWFCITFVKKSTDVSTIPGLALPCCTFKYMKTTTFFILNTWNWPKEYIYRWDPFLW